MGNWRMEWVASTLHTTSEHGVSSITTADEHTSAASSRLNWRPPADLNGLVRLAERRNLVCARVPSHFKSGLPAFRFAVCRKLCWNPMMWILWVMVGMKLGWHIFLYISEIRILCSRPFCRKPYRFRSTWGRECGWNVCFKHTELLQCQNFKQNATVVIVRECNSAYRMTFEIPDLIWIELLIKSVPLQARMGPRGF